MVNNKAKLPKRNVLSHMRGRVRGRASGAGAGAGVAKKSLSQHDDDDNNIKLSCRASAASSMHPQVIRPTSISIALSTPITVHERVTRCANYVLLPPQGVHKTTIICQRQRHLSRQHAPGWVSPGCERCNHMACDRPSPANLFCQKEKLIIFY